MNQTIEKDWISTTGLRCVVLRVGGLMNHRCGYVGVAEGAFLYGKSYSEQLPLISQGMADNTPIGLKSPILAFTAGVDSDGDGLVRRSLDIAINVHGGITYSRDGKEYPVASDLWWFGFDCAHCDDSEDGGQSLEYCIDQCESMAAQLVELQRA